MFLLLSSSIAFWTGGQAAPSEPVPEPAAPRVVATSPVQGSEVGPGPLVLSVTFDRPMLDGNYSFVQMSADTYPECENPPALSEDRRTFSLSCTLAAGRQYEIWFNRPPHMSFMADDGVRAEPYQLLFSAGRE